MNVQGALPSYAYLPSSMTKPSSYMKSMLSASDYAVWIAGVTIQVIGMIVLTFHGPKDGDTASDTTFLYAGWGVFVVGTIVILVKIFRLRK